MTCPRAGTGYPGTGYPGAGPVSEDQPNERTD